MTVPATDWMDQAACAGHRRAPTLWVSPRASDRAQARRICAGCPVREECLQYALDCEGSIAWAWGIYGGLDEYERWDGIRRSRAGWRARRTA